jgi:selenocysteine lyase/cysteine desulfurase
MTLQELQTNEELRRHEFPVVANHIFLGHGAVCPMPRRVRDAIHHMATRGMEVDQDAGTPHQFVSDTRSLVARCLGVEPAEVAFVGPTSTALSLVAGGIRWRRSQNVVIYHDDYPANVYPWMALSDRGVQVRLLNIRELGRIRLIDVQGQVDENTRLVALSSAHFVSGWQLQVSALGAWLRSRGIWFCLDAIQTLGAFPVSARDTDFFAADLHKWMLGPCAAGIFCVRQERQVDLTPILNGWNNVRCPQFISQEAIDYRRDARRFEAGSHNLLGLAGIRAAFLLLEEIGVQSISQDLLEKRRWLVGALQARGCEVLMPTPPAENTSGITTFRVPGQDTAQIHRGLTESGVVASLRSTRDGQNWLRFTPHYYNTLDELHRAVELLPAA